MEGPSTHRAADTQPAIGGGGNLKSSTDSGRIIFSNNDGRNSHITRNGGRIVGREHRPVATRGADRGKWVNRPSTDYPWAQF